jgi:electron transfer flavoprotein beta subunit
MRIVVCAKEVLDPDAVNNYALAGRLEIGDDGKTITQSAIPQLINGFDEQAIEAALKLRDAGADFTLTVISIGSDQKALLKHSAALGADEIVALRTEATDLDASAAANILTAYIQSSGGADLVLCGRQASDDDQGVVPALIAEALGMPLVPIARSIELKGEALSVTRVTADGDEVVEGNFPAVVTVSNELGDPRFPTAKGKMAARKKKPTLVNVDELGLSADALAPKVKLTKQFVPEIQGDCEFLTGSPAEVAQKLIENLRADSVIQ